MENIVVKIVIWKLKWQNSINQEEGKEFCDDQCEMEYRMNELGWNRSDDEDDWSLIKKKAKFKKGSLKI